MKCFLLIFATASLHAQIFSFGVKGGLPVTSVTESGGPISRIAEIFDFEMKRYTMGPTVEARIPFGFRVEVDGLYQRVGLQTFSGPAPNGQFMQIGERANAWEIPMLLKRRFTHGRFAPYASAGAALRTIGDVHFDALTSYEFPGFMAERQQFTQASGEPLAVGIVAAGGVSIKILPVRIEPEVRYTHWTSQRFLAGTEQVEVLVGVTFP